MNEITEGKFPEVRSRPGTLDFKPTCTKQLLMEQERYMREYIRCLETRAEVEGVDL
ncbi:crAss001_48 related protein [Blautia sp. MCC269]|uniref:crAss001_48 related protein n=1 Tax=Blautia sp. MCC269 TaxID=2592638 RepID=UPI001C01F052|nr:hypothetical protein [Blautia sp. MCC269]MBT9803469.1 hypothetical protein [Blautia sp. MCC269]